ncbi:flagellar hook protein FlgE [Bordetella ansorpii]|uniref:Flagellar hook protein FlgE n=1 Tax=Bordetella ansorpii TaxID=288768 RepID=A0A157SLV1_9BORD|nr:flagellar hook-basal body complex protein [Bordetella ansorpii]SAI71261.1 flagellar hook protein FlgE [Bordetella ansorpii]
MGFGQGLSGLNAASQNLDVIGNNIANSGTVGFKSGNVSFADVYANSRVGLGVKVSGINQRFTVGNVATTGGEYDIAIDGAKGFFRLTDQAGGVFYSRNGEFLLDKDFFIVNQMGMRLTGYPAGSIGAAPVELAVPQGNIAPVATTTVGVTTNLNANATPIDPVGSPAVPETLGVLNFDDGTGAANHNFRQDAGGAIVFLDGAGATDTALNGTFTSGGDTFTVTNGVVTAGTFTPGTAYVAPVAAVAPKPFDATDRTTYTDQVPTTVYDSLGNAHEMVQYFVKRPSAAGESVYDVYYTLDGNAMTVGTAADDHATLTFNASGALQTTPPNYTVNFGNPGGTTSPADPLAITVGYTGVTQFGSDFSPKLTPNGYASGEFLGIEIAADGSVTAQYSNGQNQVVGVIALANFNNVQGLQPVGNNAWQETNASGQPLLGQPGTNSLSSLVGQSLEQSNVNLSNELVNMIIAQRTYQANTQTIKTQDEVLQVLLNI